MRHHQHCLQVARLIAPATVCYNTGQFVLQVLGYRYAKFTH